MNKLTAADWKAAADALGVDVASVRAIAEVEVRGAATLPTGEPKILFERHYFRRLTGGKYNASHPDLSGPYKAGTYGPSSRQHARLQAAAKLDREAALQSASWGMFQIMGENYKQAGYPTVQAFINDMYRGERGQLQAFVRFVRGNPIMLRALREKRWATFARLYNGPGYKANRYDIKLQEAYQKWSNGGGA